MRHYHPNLFRQCLLLTGGLALAGFGVALTTRAGLGTSPISSLPYVVTFITPLSFGMTTFAINVFFVLGQVLILRRAFPVAQYGQLGVVLLFGLFIDLGMWLGGLWVPSSYWGRLAEVALGSVVLAAGIALQIHADLLFNPGEGLVKALCRVTHVRFAWTKMGFDPGRRVGEGALPRHPCALRVDEDGVRHELGAVGADPFVGGASWCLRPARGHGGGGLRGGIESAVVGAAAETNPPLALCLRV